MGRLRRTRARPVSTPPIRWIVLLTTSVRGDPSRKELYTRQIRRWLDETGFFLYVIESSGYAFPEIPSHDRLRVVAFDLSEKLNSSSQYEARSILHFLSTVRNEPAFRHATHILKVTGRYFLDGIVGELARLSDDGTDFFLQQHRNDQIRWQNSEYFGIRRDLLENMVTPIVHVGYMEECLYEASRHNGRFRFLHPFPNRIARGGDGLVIDPL